MQFFTLAELEAVVASARQMGLHPAVRFAVNKTYGYIHITSEMQDKGTLNLFETDAVTVKASKLYEAENWKS